LNILQLFITHKTLSVAFNAGNTSSNPVVVAINVFNGLTDISKSFLFYKKWNPLSSRF